MSEDKTIDDALASAAEAFKRVAEREIAEIKSRMEDVLRVNYSAPDKATPKGLPTPRLQLRWEEDHRYSYPLTCYYELVFKINEHDCRSDSKRGFCVVELSRTSVGGNTEGRFGFSDPWSLTPFRDGAHIEWDREEFGGRLPMYVIKPNGDPIMLPPREKKSARHRVH